MTDFTFVTYAGMPALDPDDRLAVDLLRRRGFSVAASIWDDPAVDWSQAGIVIVRSTWDYDLRYGAFLSWAEAVAALTPLYNPIDLIRWNINKRYLQELGDRGVPVVPTQWLARGSHLVLKELLPNGEAAVVKPAIGLSTHGVRRVSGTLDDQRHLDKLLEQHDVLLQPYIRSVEEYGERSLIFINGVYSHAARKTAFQALLPTGEAGETSTEATGPEIAVAARAVQALARPPLYARVDLVHANAGEPLVIELELIEPTLFLGMHPRGAHRFTDALAALSTRALS